MSERKYFGTDGIRGKVGDSPITPEFVLRLGWAVGCLFKTKGQRSKILIGKDTRISGYMFESALEAGLSAAGVDVGLLGPMPTPAIAYLTRTFRASAGIVISASHNPHYDNGIKFFSSTGHKLDDAVENEIERRLEQNIKVVESAELGKAFRVNDAEGRYIEYCKSTVPSSLTLRGMKIVLDCAHGANYKVAPLVFEELGAEVIPVAVKPNGLNINDGVGSTHPESLVQAVKDNQADLGIAFDGDGDRVVMVDQDGAIVDGDELIYIIAANRHRTNRLGGGVVGTLMTNFGAELAFAQLGIPFERAKVGDRYVMEMLVRNGWLLGGEGSGHIVCLDNATTGDAIISALQVLLAMWQEGRTLGELKSGMTKLPQKMLNVRVAKKFDPLLNPLVEREMRMVTDRLNGQGRVLLRPSGTEPVIRVMVEGFDAPLVHELVEHLAGVVAKASSD
ncbi:MAG: phosphoglucosamine mutase [Hahellaceae bacterium]|nr:phosphoglucosamine mutase [Hahellaceae bacterium]MCP5168758.1 phosphoglucosamine mutase [Hahellaceae bacterium]